MGSFIEVMEARLTGKVRATPEDIRPVCLDVRKEVRDDIMRFQKEYLVEVRCGVTGYIDEETQLPLVEEMIRQKLRRVVYDGIMDPLLRVEKAVYERLQRGDGGGAGDAGRGLRGGGMRIEGDQVLFSSGKALYANGGILGLDRCLNVTAGWDNGFFEYPDGVFDDEEPTLTIDEQIELGAHMMGLWEQFKRRAELEKWEKENGK